MTPLVHVDCLQGVEAPDEDSFRRWITAALDVTQQREQLRSPEVSIRVTDSAESAALNHRYRAKDGPTNVLSFPADLHEHVDCELLGDLVLCADLVQTEADEQQKPARDHWAHLTVHGVLHLVGYDHVEDADAEVMEALEIKALTNLGIPNPYQAANP